LVTVTKTGFSAGLAWVKVKTLSRSGQVSRVRSGNRVKAFSFSGAIGLAWLARVKLR
jgi:hypothetical protein